ncbi:MAG: outer membrane lipoprotein-sorting protein [Magnetococcus sp. DMHC-6]
MKKTYWIIFFLFIGSLSMPSWALEIQSEAHNEKKIAGDQILQRVDRNLFPESAQMIYQLVNRKPNGKEETIILYIARSDRHEMVLLGVAPDYLKGRSALRVANEMWIHMPGEIDLRQMSLQEYWFGGTFNNGDILQGDYHLDFSADLTRESDQEYLLKLTSKKSQAPFQRGEMRVDKALLLPIELTYYDFGDKIAKQIKFKEIRPFGQGVTRPAILESASILNPGYVSLLKLGQIQARSFPKEAFSLQFLSNVGSILLKE